jgi:hypothetical protein
MSNPEFQNFLYKILRLGRNESPRTNLESHSRRIQFRKKTQRPSDPLCHSVPISSHPWGLPGTLCGPGGTQGPTLKSPWNPESEICLPPVIPVGRHVLCPFPIFPRIYQGVPDVYRRHLLYRAVLFCARELRDKSTVCSGGGG